MKSEYKFDRSTTFHFILTIEFITLISIERIRAQVVFLFLHGPTISSDFLDVGHIFLQGSPPPLPPQNTVLNGGLFVLLSLSTDHHLILLFVEEWVGDHKRK